MPGLNGSAGLDGRGGLKRGFLMPAFARRHSTSCGLLLACALVLAGCGDAAGPAETPQAGAGDSVIGQPTGSGGSGTPGAGVAQIAGPSGPIDTTGWVLAPPFYALGDEPFWRLEIIDGWFTFKRSALREIEEPVVQPVKAGDADVFTSGALKVTLKREPCDAGGQPGAVTAEVVFDDVEFVGCAFDAPPAAVANSAEAQAVVEGVVSIDACLAKLGQAAAITGVAPRQDGAQMSVALRAKNGTLYECGFETASGAISYLDPIEQGAQASWMMRMRFVRDGVQTSAPCADAEEVRDGDKVLGRMLAKACKF